MDASGLREQLIKSGSHCGRTGRWIPTRPPVSSSASQTSLLRASRAAGDWYYGRVMVLPTAKGAKSLSYTAIRPAALWGLSPFGPDRRGRNFRHIPGYQLASDRAGASACKGWN